MRLPRFARDAASVAVTGAILASPAGAQVRGGALTTLPLRTDTLKRNLVVRKNVLTPKLGQICTIQIPESFTYIGGQRFILQETADAEQHIFVRTDSGKVVRELVWLQVEIGIPGKSRGYTYAQDSIRRFSGLEWRVDVRSTSGFAPPPGSDGAAMRAFVAAKGYELQPMAPRLRLVYLPKPGGLEEFMIIHLTAASAAGADTTLDATVNRAKNRLNIRICP